MSWWRKANLDDAGNIDGWIKIKSIWRKCNLNDAGSVNGWLRIRSAWRYRGGGIWDPIFGGIGIPIPKSGYYPLLYFRATNGSETASSEINTATLLNQTSPAAYQTDKLFLLRGNWQEEPIEFFMRIQKSQDSGFDSGVTLVNTSSSATRTYLEYSDDDYADEVPLNSANRYTISQSDVRDGYYFRGKVEATNADNLTGIYTTDVVLPRMYATVNFSIQDVGPPISYVLNPQSNGGTFSWSYPATIKAQDISQQEFYVYPLNNTSVDALYYTGVFPGTGTNDPVTTVTFTSINLSPNTEYTILIKTTMQDGWASNTNNALRTIITDQKTFKTAVAKPLAPTNVTATDVGTNRPFNNGAVSLSWSQASNGVSITGYKIEYSVGPDYLVYSVLNSNTGNNSTSGTFTGLDSNKNYKFVVTAIGSLANSDPSADSNAVLITTVPREPNGISAVAGNALANVYFTASNFNGGKTVTDFRATSNPDNLTDSNNFSPIEVTGLTNYTSYTFTVAARNANGYSIESVASSAVTPTMPAPVGSGTVTIASQSNANYIYQITSYGTWSNSPTSYDYEWQTSSDGGANWTTRSSGTDVATIPDYNASSYKAQNIRLRVYGRNQTGPAISPLTSNTLFIFYTSPVITSLTVTGGAGLLIWNFAYSADDPVVDIDLEYKLSSSSTYTLIPVTTTSGQEIVAAGTYDFRVFITNSVNGAFRSDFETVTNIVVTGAPTASGFARSDSTATPSQPSTLSFSSSNNQVTTSWTNGSPITSVNFAASGAGVNTNYTDSSAPFMISDLSAYSSSGTYTATVTNFNNSLQVRASWNQSNSQSYKVHYSSSVFGADETSIINNSASSVNHDIGWSSGAGSFTFQAVTLYSGANGTGTSNFFSTGLSAITPSQKSSSRSGSTSLTYQLPNLITNPAYGTATSTSGGWTASITTQPNPTGGTYSVVSTTVGSASVNSSTGALTASGLSSGQSSTVTVRYSRSGYNSVDITASGSSVAAIIPTITMGSNSGVSTTGGTINWSSTNQASFSSSGTFSGSGTTGTSISKTGLTPSTTYTGTVTVTSSTGNTASANYSLTTLTQQYTVTWNANGGTGGGSTTQNAGVAHIAPSPGTRSGYTFAGYSDTPSGDRLYGPIASGGTFTPPSSMTMYARWTLNFVTPTAPAPSLNTQRLSGSSFIRFYCDYPSPSGNYSSITGMAFEIRTTAGGGTLLASATRPYPGDGQFPYNVGGVGWAFKAGVDGQVSDITYSASTRFCRARVVLAGTDGNTYFGTWSGWSSV